MGEAQVEFSRTLALIQSCNRHAIRANVNKPSKQAKRRECQSRGRLVQKYAGRKALLAGYLIPLLQSKKKLQQRNTIPNSAGMKKWQSDEHAKATPPDYRYRSLPLFLLGKDKPINLKLTIFFILPRNRAIFQKTEGKSFKNNWFWQYFCPQLSRAKEDVTPNSVIVHEIRTDCFSEGNDMRWVATCKVFRQFDNFMGTNWF